MNCLNCGFKCKFIERGDLQCRNCGIIFLFKNKLKHKPQNKSNGRFSILDVYSVEIFDGKNPDIGFIIDLTCPNSFKLIRATRDRKYSWRYNVIAEKYYDQISFNEIMKIKNKYEKMYAFA